jgi:hypothetical protein
MPIPAQWRAHADFVLVLVIMVLAYACGGSPTGPREIVSSPPVDTTPLRPNDVPVVNSLTTSSPRVEADQEVVVTARVQDDITPIDQLTYEWSAKPVNGTFTGSGPQVRWRAPHLEATPDTYALTLKVVEKYTERGVAKENSATSTVQVHYNDSTAEIRRLSVGFLNDFATYSMSAQQCVRNFSNSCPGKAAELSDIQANRANLQIQSARLGTPAVVLNGDLTFANSNVPCTFVSIQKATGKTETATGTCLLTAVYENFTWFLCDSHFTGSATTAIRGLHP